jgi:hypothetical protein
VADLSLLEAQHIAAEAGKGPAGAQAEQAGSDDYELPAFSICHINYDMR